MPFEQDNRGLVPQKVAITRMFHWSLVSFIDRTETPDGFQFQHGFQYFVLG